MCGHRWTGGPDLPEVRVVRVRPGDVLVLAYADPITPDDARRASELLKAEFPGHRAVITSRAELLVVRPDEADLIEEGKAP
ncbi:hypothetical protein [Umezawaea tangerina]|nr:hypothetical protein [Umezawaea tangerina]